jgi:hypothetical protein
MSSFYDDASLVLIPSGYKTSKIYAEKPTNGSGDLTFTRDSGATRVGPDGLIEKVRTNLVLQSQAFNTTWAPTAATVTANTTANPLDGAVNSDTITLTGATTQKFVAQAVAQNGIYTYSVYAKAGTHNFIQLMLGNDAAVYSNFNISTGSVTASSGCVASIVSVGSGWYRCSMAYSTTTADNVFILAIDSGTDGRFSTSSSTGTFILFGAQLETGDIATSYLATTTAAVSAGPVINVPRLDYLGSSCPRLLLEPQRTNNLVYSEQFNNAIWVTDGNGAGETKTANYAISPDGYQNADRIQLNRTGGSYSRVRQDYVAAGAHTASVYLKSNTGLSQKVWMRVDGSNATKITITTSWQRFVLSGASSGGLELFIDNSDAEIATIADFSAWGAQLEAGAYATSYIPTPGASSVTRVADAASKTGISSLIGQTEGTLFVEEFHDASVANLNGYDDTLVAATDGTSANIIAIFHYGSGGSASNIAVFFIRLNNVTQAAIISSSLPTGTYKMALAYKNNDVVAYINGVQVGTDTSATIPATSVVTLVDPITTGAATKTVRNSQTLLFKTRLTNAQLAELTSL